MPVPSGTPPSAFLGAPSLPALPTLRLGDYLPELPAGVAYSSPVVIFRTSEAAAAQFVVSAGAKGVRWNVRKSRKQNGNKARDTKAAAQRTDAEEAPGPSSGARALYEWTERLQCARAGVFKSKANQDLSPRKKRSHHAPSAKAGCNAQIYLRKYLNADPASAVEVEFRWGHDGHEPGTLRDMAQSKLSRESKAWLDECILHQGMDWRQIKDLLRLDDTILDALENDSSLAAVPESLLISHKDIYNRIRKRLLEVATLHRNGFRSLELWKEKLLEAGYDVFYEKISARATGEEHHFVFGFVSPWQKKLLQKYNKIACLDSTHHTCFSATGRSEKAYLYSVVLKNLDTGRGVPAAFMLTPSEAQYAVGDFLRWLRIDLGFKCRLWMIDCSDAEVAGIRAGIGPDTTIWWCIWHVLKAVREQAKEKLSVKSGSRTEKIAANKALRDAAVADFKRLVYADDAQAFDTTWEEVCRTYAAHRDWLRYVASQWISNKARWAMHYRKDTPAYGITTNNYIESWHHVLKTNYLKLARRQRIDVLLHILTTRAIPDLHRTHVRCTLGFEAPRINLAESKALAQAEALDTDVAEEMVEGPNDGTADYVVQSFKDADTTYRVHLMEICADESRGGDFTGIVSCSCPHHTLHQLRCKHMYLVARITAHPFAQAPERTAASATAAAIAAASKPCGPSTDELRAQKQAQSERIIRELRTALSYAEKLAGAELDAVGREELHQVETRAVAVRREVGAVLRHERVYEFNM